MTRRFDRLEQGEKLHMQSLGARADFEVCAKVALMKRGRAAVILDEVIAAVRRWPSFASEAGLSDEWRDKIQKALRLSLPKA